MPEIKPSSLPARPYRLCLVASLLLLGFPLAASGQGVDGPLLRPVVEEGVTEVPGVGVVTGFGSFWVNDRGEWIADLDTDNVDPDLNSVLLLNGDLVVREGDPFAPAPPGSVIDSFDSVTLTNAGTGGFNFFLDNVADDSGVYALVDPSLGFEAGSVEVIQEGDDVPDFPAGTPALGFFDVKANEAGQLLVTASIDAAAIPSTVDRALFIWTPDPAGGIAASTLIAAEGDVLPGQSVALTDFGTGFQETAFNDEGEALFVVDIPGADAIYCFNGALFEIAQEGDPSPVAGRNWQSLSPASVALNDQGEFAFIGRVDGDAGSDRVLVVNGSKLVQEGDALPSIAPFVLEEIEGPVWLSEKGDVLWAGKWSSPDNDMDEGLFLNDQLWIQEGVTRTESGEILIQVFTGDSGFQLSDSGDYALVRGLTDTIFDAIYRVNLGIFNDGFESGDTSRWSGSAGEL